MTSRSLKTFGSTGEPWNPEPWWWLFRDVGEERIPIVNISGGTEVGACILSVNLLQGIKPTSLGTPALGMDADVYDDNGEPLRGEVGELVIRGSWPGMTRGFWDEPDRYIATYWSRFDDTWVHGDWASVDDDGFWYLHGRSDDTLNIAGKRIGPAEIESVAVALPQVVMAAAIGVPDDLKGEAIALYLVAAPGVEPDETLSGECHRRHRKDSRKGFSTQNNRVGWRSPKDPLTENYATCRKGFRHWGRAGRSDQSGETQRVSKTSKSLSYELPGWHPGGGVQPDNLTIDHWILDQGLD